MSLAAKRLFQVQAPNSLTTEYTTPSNTITQLREIVLCNTDTAARTVQVCIVPSGGTAAAATAVLWNFSIAAGQAVPFPFNQYLAVGDFIAVQADVAAKVTVTASGLELT